MPQQDTEHLLWYLLGQLHEGTLLHLDVVQLLLGKDQSEEFTSPHEYMILLVQIGWVGAHSSDAPEVITLVGSWRYVLKWDGGMHGMRPVTGAMLENIHLRENNCERGLPRADRGS